MDYTALCSARWDALCSRLSVGAETAATWWSTLHDAYEGPGRYYHTLRHVAELLLHLDAHRASVSDVDAVELATFFHDVVYNAQSGGGGRNELDSAEVWRDFARAAQLAALEEKVARWIVQTKDHRCTDADELDCKLFMDFDMAILATPPAEYAAYAANVRREYGHLSTAAWCYGRGAFLRSFAQSDAPIFATPAFRDAGEAAARRNAATEAVMLRRRRRRRLLAMVALTGACGALSLLALFAPSGMLRGGARLCGAAAGALGLAWAGTQYEPYPYAKAPGAAAGGVALFAGSMNPPHHGHLGIIAHLAAAHASVVVVIGHNPSKRYAVTPQQRKELTEKACQAAGLRNVTCEVTDDYVWRVARKRGAKVLHRGIRSWAQDGVAERWLELQNVVGPMALALAPPLRTHYWQADPRYAHVSSSLVRQRCSAAEAIDDLVPAAIAAEVRQAYGAQAAREKAD